MPCGLFPFRVNLKTMILSDSETPGTGDQPFARPLHTQGDTNTEERRYIFKVSSGIRSQDLGVQEGKVISRITTAPTVIYAVELKIQSCSTRGVSYLLKCL
jgi:hypothetical protein